MHWMCIHFRTESAIDTISDNAKQSCREARKRGTGELADQITEQTEFDNLGVLPAACEVTFLESCAAAPLRFTQ
jgi:hypothetical protein